MPNRNGDTSDISNVQDLTRHKFPRPTLQIPAIEDTTPSQGSSSTSPVTKDGHHETKIAYTDYSLVPKPLAVRRQVPHISVSTTLRITQMDASAAIIAGGVAATTVAILMGLTPEELIGVMAVVAIALRDFLVDLDTDNYSSVPSKYETSVIRIEPDENMTIEDAIQAWEQTCEDEETLVAYDPDATEERSRETTNEIDSPQRGDQIAMQGGDDENPVFYDAPESRRTGSVLHETPSRGYEDRTTISFRRVADLEEARRRDVLAAIAALPVQQVAVTLPAPPVFPAYQAKWLDFLSGIPVILLIIQALLLGRLLGILLSEWQMSLEVIKHNFGVMSIIAALTRSLTGFVLGVMTGITMEWTVGFRNGVPVGVLLGLLLILAVEAFARVFGARSA